jgi:hypothetical protein
MTVAHHLYAALVMRTIQVAAIGSFLLATGFASGWTTEGWHRDHGSGTFAQKQQCLTLAEEYRRQQQEALASDGYSMNLLHVVYSGVRNTCVAEVQAEHNPPDFREYKVIDLLSKETLSSDGCSTVEARCLPGVEAGVHEAFVRALATSGELPLPLKAPGVQWDK